MIKLQLQPCARGRCTKRIANDGVNGGGCRDSLSRAGGSKTCQMVLLLL
ncbi:MAG: hypothetical protein LRY53_04360 [Burkholderiaceae bacterium]|nr:hypothetical protein [Burkholderiaceae bacterium]MCD8564876.1 hypothetical protein [Burkholderiaceae bacterium]